MFIGDDIRGLTGLYNTLAVTDGFRNITAINADFVNCAVPLPVDLNIGDTVKICGIAYIIKLPNMTDPQFHITVSHFSCSDVDHITQVDVPTFTVIPVSTYDMSQKNTVCFSEEIVLAEIFPACNTFFVVGLSFTDNNEAEKQCKFSYTLEVTQACIGNNLLIRNCCDPAYSEVILDNGTAVGASFVDDELNCWTVDSLTTANVTGIRTKVTGYTDCATCLTANPCPENLVVDSCCAIGEEFFSGALPGVNVGDTFVDTNGYCWSVTGTTPLPITNVVAVGTSFPATDCLDEICISANSCPTPVLLISCCKLGKGVSTLEILQAAVPTLAVGDFFVDTFGFCWRIELADPGFPTLSFITPVTEEGDCREDPGCITVNPCPETVYYTVQNCCTEEIETVLIDSAYNLGQVLTIIHTTGAGCYRIISWSDTGTATLTVVSIPAVARECQECIQQVFKGYCQGFSQCCSQIQNIGNNAIITGYQCDGTWLLDYVMTPEEVLCMAFIAKTTGSVNDLGCCIFDVYNPSLTTSIDVSVLDCGNNNYNITIPAGAFLSNEWGCAFCVVSSTGPWEYSPCP
jgi:hypothetical protein